MPQKYKFFVKESVVIFRQAAVFGANDQEACLEWIKRLDAMNIVEDHLVDLPDLEAFIQQLIGELKYLIAAGGFVLNDAGQLLMIHRRGFWDLPKGKQENNESIEDTAVREVEEECGIDGLKILSPPFSTYHLYRENEQTILKESVWYEMSTSNRRALTPQIEEDILKAEWKTLPIDDKIRAGAYASILEVIDHFSGTGSSDISGG